MSTGDSSIASSSKSSTNSESFRVNALPCWGELAQELVRRGACVCVHDPAGLANARTIYKDDGFLFCDTPAEAAKNADALVIATDWADYRALDWSAIRRLMRGACLFDARNLLRDTMAKNPHLLDGFEYQGL